MGVTKEETLVESDGCDQLDRTVGSVVRGDIVTIMYRGWYLDKKSGKRKEFEDMFHSEKKLKFVVGETAPEQVGVFRGLSDGVQLMVLGEKAKLAVTSDYGFGEKEHKGYVGVVPPDSNLVLELTIMSVARNNTVHNRKQPKDASGCLSKVLYCLCRAY